MRTIGDGDEKAAPNRYHCAAPGNRGSAHNNLTEDQLSDAVCKKFYSDMPQEQFATGGALIRFLALSAIAFASAAHAQDCDKIFQRPYYNTAELDTPPDSPEKARARAERVAYINCLAEKHETENSSKTEAPAPLPLPPNVSRKVARILPPVEYDHPYNGKLTVAIVNKEQMARLCPKLYPITLSCAYPYETMSMCQIVMITDDIIAAAGWTPKIVLRHELGHCNGWPNDHRGARVLPAERTRSEGRKK